MIPGMILDLELPGTDEGAQPAPVHVRLFAPAEPHTTTRAGRTCVACHLDPVALGYGRGSLVLDNQPWSHIPEFPSHPADGLPLDAWIGFFEDPVIPHSTRSNTRPFSPKEQLAILRAGACLSCHDGDSPIDAGYAVWPGGRSAASNPRLRRRRSSVAEMARDRRG